MTKDLIERADALAAIALGDTVNQLQAKILAIPARGEERDRADNLRRAIAYAMTELAQSAQDAPAIRAETALIRAFKADAVLAPAEDVRAGALREALRAIDALPEYQSPDVNIGVGNAYSAIVALIPEAKT